MPILVLLRHGESVWNRDNRFTGWTDVELSDTGIAEASAAGRALKSAGLEFQSCHTSYLKRAIKTLWLALETMDRMWLPVANSWRLNERHYGALQGLNKAETAAKFGEEQVKIWRRSYDVPPPALQAGDPRLAHGDPRYAALAPAQLPLTESLADTIARVSPYWNAAMVPELRGGKNLLVAAHGNSLRALIKHLESISDKDVVKLEIPTGRPLVYELDAALKPVSRRYLDR